MILKQLKRAILLLAPLFFISCEKPTDDLGFEQIIGGVVEADSMHLNLVTWTAPVDSIIVALDYNSQLSLGGYNPLRLLGRTESNLFGSEEAYLHTQVIPDELDLDFGQNPIVDSVYFYLRITDSYGDTSQAMNLVIHELEEEFSQDSIYYSSYSPALGAEIGRLDGYMPKAFTNTRFEGELAPPVIAIPMDINFFQTAFADIADGSADEFSSFGDFLEYFYGLRVAAETGKAILDLNLASNYTGLRVYYHNDDDTTFAEFNIDQDKSLKPINFSTFEQFYSGSPLENMAQDSLNGEAQTYIQSMGGVCTALKFDPAKVQNLIQQGFIINSAAVEVYTVPNTGEPVAPSSNMEIRILDGKSLGDRIIDFQSESGGGALSRGVLRNNKYVMDLRRHLFEVLNSGENPTLALVPRTRTTAANRTVIRGGEGLMEKATVIVYYTKP